MLMNTHFCPAACACRYYKRMSIPDLKVGGAAGKLDAKFLNYKHANNTLIISVRRHCDTRRAA